MSTRRYIGGRYLPKFEGDWDTTKEYEPLMIVKWQGTGFISKTYVPSNVTIDDVNYWLPCGVFNPQLEQYITTAKSLKVGVENARKQMKYFRTSVPFDESIADKVSGSITAHKYGSILIIEFDVTMFVNETTYLRPSNTHMLCKLPVGYRPSGNSNEYYLCTFGGNNVSLFFDKSGSTNGYIKITPYLPLNKQPIDTAYGLNGYKFAQTMVFHCYAENEPTEFDYKEE